MKILALVVTFHPQKDLLLKNIGAFINQVDQVIVWRNSDEELAFLEKWKDKILFFGDKKNKYLASPINQIMDYAINHDFDFVLTMDQDSEWENFNGFKDIVSKQWIKYEDVGIYAPNVNNYLKDPNIKYQDIEWVIQSGMLINLRNTKGLGGFREDYGIYGIDEEFCYWLRMNNLKIRSFTNFHLKQRYGDCKKTRFGFNVYNYSPLVRYFMIRNMIWMKREFSESTTLRRIIHVIFNNYRDIILVEDNKLKKLHSLNKGILDGLFKSYSQRTFNNYGN